MNNVKLFAKSLLITVPLEGYDIDSLDAFNITVIIDNKERVYHFDKKEIRRQGAQYSGFCKVMHFEDDLFLLDDLKVLCKYPVNVFCFIDKL